MSPCYEAAEDNLEGVDGLLFGFSRNAQESFESHSSACLQQNNPLASSSSIPVRNLHCPPRDQEILKVVHSVPQVGFVHPDPWFRQKRT